MPDIGQGLTGGLGGAATGFAIGGPLGAGIGGGLGLLGGLFGGGPKPNRDDFLLPGFQDRADRLVNLGGQYGGFNEQSRGTQADLIRMLQAGAAGNGPSAARNMLQETTNENISQQQALASTGRSNQGFQQRQALNNAALIQQRAANQASLLRAQEQQAAQALLGNVAGQQRQQDITSQLAMLENELRNAQLQQGGTIGYQNALLGQSGQAGFGDQILSGGGSLLAAQLAARGRG